MGAGGLVIVSRHWSLVIGQLGLPSWQLAVGSWQLGVDTNSAGDGEGLRVAD